MLGKLGIGDVVPVALWFSFIKIENTVARTRNTTHVEEM
jgi:hypothetical protein